MRKTARNKKTIVLCCLIFCLAAVGINQYMKTFRVMDVILFMGQSNMSGANGDASQAPELIEGAGYEYRAITDPDKLHVLQEPFGEMEHKEGYLDDRELLERKGSLVTAFVNAYYEKTGVPVVAVSASRGSSSINSWLNRGLLTDAQERLSGARTCLKKERVKIRHIYMVWFQGEADANKETTEEEYLDGMGQILSSMSEVGVEQCFLIQIGDHMEEPGHHTLIQRAQEKLCEESDLVSLASVLPAKLSEEGMVDKGGVHFTQEALNLIGTDAGNYAGEWVLEKSTSEE